MKKLNNNKQMKDVWTTSLTKPSEKKCGKHPTQKPLKILKRIINLSTKKGEIVLTPFAGSGSECVAAIETNRKYIGFEVNNDYIEIAKNRLENVSINNIN